MVMNLRLMRENKISDKLWNIKIKLSQDSSLTTMDQDALNEGLKGKVMPLSIKWNLNTYFTQKTDIKKLNMLCGEEFENLEQLLDEAKIIHYVGKEDKPWKFETARCRFLWDEYYIKCGFDIKDLSRSSVNYGIKWKMRIAKNIVKSAGIKGLIRFIHNKL